MGFFDKLKGAVGIGQPKVELVLDKNSIAGGETINCTVNVIGGTRELPMKEISVSVYRAKKYVDSEGNKKVDKKKLDKVVENLGGKILKEGDTPTYNLNIEIPWDFIPSNSQYSYYLLASIDVPGLDATSKQEIDIRPGIK